MAVAGNAQHELARGETGSNPSLNGLCGGTAARISRTRVIQRRIGANTRGPLTLQDELSDMLPG